MVQSRLGRGIAFMVQPRPGRGTDFMVQPIEKLKEGIINWPRKSNFQLLFSEVLLYAYMEKTLNGKKY